MGPSELNDFNARSPFGVLKQFSFTNTSVAGPFHELYFKAGLTVLFNFHIRGF